MTTPQYWEHTHSRARQATAGERFAVIGATFFCCSLMLATVFDVISPNTVLGTMVLFASLGFTYVLARSGRRLRLSYRLVMIVGLVASAGLLIDVPILSELCFGILGLAILVLKRLEKKGLKWSA